MFVSFYLVSLCPSCHANVVDALKMCSNFKRCIYAYKIVFYSRPIYKYNLDAMPMLFDAKITAVAVNHINLHLILGDI